jgi:two-component system response regulator DctR
MTLAKISVLAQHRLHRHQHGLVVVTGVADVPTTVAMMERGAVTLLEKPYNHDDLVRAVERGLAVSRERWLQKLNQKSVVERLATLSEDERRVMECMLTGQPNKAVAHRLELSMRTVDRRRQAVLEKMGVRTAPELALLLGAAGISTPASEVPESEKQQIVATD